MQKELGKNTTTRFVGAVTFIMISHITRIVYKKYIYHHTTGSADELLVCRTIAAHASLLLV